MAHARILILGAMLLGASAARAEEPSKTVHDCLQGYVGLFNDSGRDDPQKRSVEQASQELRERCFTPAFARKVKKGGGDEDAFLHSQDVMQGWVDHITLQDLDLGRGRVRAILGEGADLLCLELGLKKLAAGWRIDSSRTCSVR